MRRPGFLRSLPAPIVTASLLVLLAIAIGFWGHRATGSHPEQIAQIARTRAKLSDGDCEFAADVHLASRWSGWAFSLREGAVRNALVALLRSKSRYMVATNPAREALRVQMLDAVNGVIGSGRATDLRITEFEFL
jgi:hypothetical protein